MPKHIAIPGNIGEISSGTTTPATVRSTAPISTIAPTPLSMPAQGFPLWERVLCEEATGGGEVSTGIAGCVEAGGVWVTVGDAGIREGTVRGVSQRGQISAEAGISSAQASHVRVRGGAGGRVRKTSSVFRLHASSEAVVVGGLGQQNVAPLSKGSARAFQAGLIAQASASILPFPPNPTSPLPIAAASTTPDELHHGCGRHPRCNRTHEPGAGEVSRRVEGHQGKHRFAQRRALRPFSWWAGFP